jgi:hypothetical protein
VYIEDPDYEVIMPIDEITADIIVNTDETDFRYYL